MKDETARLVPLTEGLGKFELARPIKVSVANRNQSFLLTTAEALALHEELSIVLGYPDYDRSDEDDTDYGSGSRS